MEDRATPERLAELNERYPVPDNRQPFLFLGKRVEREVPRLKKSHAERVFESSLGHAENSVEAQAEHKLRAWGVYIRPQVSPNPKKRSIKSLRERLLAKHGPTCIWCKKECVVIGNPNMDMFATVEHMTRRADGGKSNMENCRIACRKCNNERHSQPPRKSLAAQTPLTATIFPPASIDPGRLLTWLTKMRNDAVTSRTADLPEQEWIALGSKARAYSEVLDYVRNQAITS